MTSVGIYCGIHGGRSGKLMVWPSDVPHAVGHILINVTFLWTTASTALEPRASSSESGLENLSLIPRTRICLYSGTKTYKCADGPMVRFFIAVKTSYLGTASVGF